MLPLLLAAALASEPVSPQLADGAGWRGAAPVFDLGSPVAPRLRPVPSSLRAIATLPALKPPAEQVAFGWAALAVIALSLDPESLGTPAQAWDRGLSLSDRGRPWELAR